MVKRILSVFAGVAVAMIVIIFFEWITGQFNTAPTAADFSNGHALAMIMHKVPRGTFLLLLIGYILGSGLGGIAATFVSGRDTNIPALVTGAAALVWGMFRLMLSWHPMWFVVVSVLSFIPSAYLGYMLLREPESEFSQN